MTANSAATSASVRAIGPTVSSAALTGNVPRRLTSP